MTEFLYRARDQQGQLITGNINAENPKVVEAMIANQGLIPISVTVASKSSSCPE